MNRSVIIGAFVAGAIAGGVALNTIDIGDAAAAPFNAVKTMHADQGVVVRFCVYRVDLPDGGSGGATFDSTMRLTEVRSLPDGGSRPVTTFITSEQCALSGANLTAAGNFASGPAAICARASHDMEQ